jgi:SOS-response transcriptional repressor LexA
MDDHIILQSENNNYSPIVAGKDEVSVEGVVKGVIQMT